MLGLSKNAVAGAIGVLVIIGGILLLVRYFQDDSARIETETLFLSAGPSDQLVTSYATVAEIRIRLSDGALKGIDSLEEPEVGLRKKLRNAKLDEKANLTQQLERAADALTKSLNEATGFCYRAYRLSIGFDLSRVSNFITDDREITPVVLSANTLEARQSDSKGSIRDCDVIDLATDSTQRQKRLDTFQAQLDADGVWRTHVDHSRTVITQFSPTLRKFQLARLARAKDSLGKLDDLLSDKSNRATGEVLTSDALAEAQALLGRAHNDVATDPGAPADAELPKTVTDIRASAAQARASLQSTHAGLGTVAITLSIVAIVSQDEGWWVWENQEFYLRKDIAIATFGVPLADVRIPTSRRWWGARAPLIVPTPRLLSIDRFVRFAAASKKDFMPRHKDNNGTEATNIIELSMRKSLEKNLRELHGPVTELSRAILRARIQEASVSNGLETPIVEFEEEGTSYSEFLSSDSEGPSAPN